MAIPQRHKNANWTLPESPTFDSAQLAVLMDIRDEMQQQNRHLSALVGLANCYRIPRALDALADMGADLRRKKRAAAKKRQGR